MNEEYLRIDKWLWAARFFKTRSLAAKAVEGGRVRLNGEGAKPSRALKPGDELAIRVGELEWVVEVMALSRQRGPAAQAALRQDLVELQTRHNSAAVPGTTEARAEYLEIVATA